MRRKVYEARKGYPNESGVVLAKFKQLYDIETLGKAMSSDERFALRRRVAAPIWESLGIWLDGEKAQAVLPKSGLGKALGYLRNHWDALQLYLKRSTTSTNRRRPWARQLATIVSNSPGRLRDNASHI